MTERIRIGTRRSRLARAQTDLVIARLVRAAPELRFESVPIITSGDRDRSVGGSPDFTDAIDRALLRRDVDLAVHSAKDLPLELDHSLELLVGPPPFRPPRLSRRSPPVSHPPTPSRGPGRLEQPSSTGPAAPLESGPYCRRDPGNLNTRMNLVRSGAIDSAVLAVAGISRLGRTGEIGRILPSATFLPAPAQGALAVVARVGDSALASAVRRIDHPPTHVCVTAERTFAAALGGDCRLPLGALATAGERTVSLVGEVLTPDGRMSLRRRQKGPVSDPESLGSGLGKEMRDRGALDLVSPSRP